MTTTTETTTPNPIDIAVGAKIRQRRKYLGLSQEALADALGITFQQVQKYERGSNRISASKMYAAAKALKCTPASLFPSDEENAEAEAHLPDWLAACRRVESMAPGLIDTLATLGRTLLFNITRITNAMRPEIVIDARALDAEEATLARTCTAEAA